MSEKAAKLDWNNLKFEYEDINCHVKAVWKNGAWSQLEEVKEPYVTMHIGATVLHYGQAAFEGLKAFATKNGKVQIFRPEENAERLAHSCRRIMMPEVPKEMFLEAVKTTVRKNLEFVPPCGTGSSLYIRPFIFGSGPCVGLKPSPEYTFIVTVTPVGDYYKGGAKAVSALVMDQYDRAAPRGLGNTKVGGNYAGALYPNQVAQDMGLPITLYLDAKEHRYIEEFNSSNFVAINSEGRYVTPVSDSILKSITNKSLMTLAKDMGITVEERVIEFAEVKGFTEVGAVGTAVIITPINRIIRGDVVYQISPLDGFGPVLGALYKKLNGIRNGEEEDKHGWMVDI